MLKHILEDLDMLEVFVRSYNNYDGDERSLETGYVEDMPSLAIQSQKDEADINNIVRMFGVTGKLPESVRVPTYGDFSMVEDYQTAIHAIREAEASFMKMPADTRSRFGNDPQKFLEFCDDPGNLEEMRKLGLAVPKIVVDDGEVPSP
ncbi:MAG: internal scaffolding protein [Microvirus sp.]|nr:MAG: internal scaffolding protein [Microvirus sp.]